MLLFLIFGIETFPMRIICKYILFFSIILFAVSLTSCHSSKKNTEKKDKYEETQGGKAIMGIKVDKNDNIRLYREAEKWIGVPYKYGGNSKRGTDCSGMVMEIYLKVYGIKLERNSAAIMERNCRKISKNNLQEGDLVFFTTSKDRNRINHVGIYLKEGKFVHSSSSRGVIVSSLSERYYVDKFYCAGKVRQR